MFTSILLCSKKQYKRKDSGVFFHLPPLRGISYQRERQRKKKRHKEEIDFLHSAYIVLFCRLLLPASLVFGALWVVLEKQPEGGEAKQKGLDEPQAASGRVADTFVTAEARRRNK